MSLLLSLTFLLIPALDFNAPPRYQFKVGQEIKYKSSGEFLSGKGETKSILGNRSELTAWVSRLNPDGSWRLLVQSESFSWQQMKSTDRKNERSQGKTLSYFDIHPNGNIISNDSLGERFNPATYFPRLPDNDQTSWEVGKPGSDVIRYNMATDARPGEFVINVVRDDPMDKIYLITSRIRLLFDPSTALVKKGHAENTQGYGFDGKGTGTIELVSVQMRGDDFIQPLASAAEVYFETTRKYADISRTASKSGSKAQTLMNEAEQLLKDTVAATKVPIIKEQLENQLKQHQQYAKYSIEEAERLAKLIGKPAAAWKTTDLEGKEYSNDSLKGKVVVMDFWYRGCGWCIKAMPQINELVDDFKNDPVIIIGMNTDREEKDARFVIEAMKLKYRTLKAEGLPPKFGVQGFPTLVIIDQQGNVHDLHVGYSKNLRQEVGKIIRKLLDKQ